MMPIPSFTRSGKPGTLLFHCLTTSATAKNSIRGKLTRVTVMKKAGLAIEECWVRESTIAIKLSRLQEQLLPIRYRHCQSPN
jgi:hypothetical protein